MKKVANDLSDNCYRKLIFKACLFYFFEIVLLMISMNIATGTFDKQGTSIKINDTGLFFYSEEYYTNNFLPITLTSRTYNFELHPKTFVKKSNKYYLKINECEFYYDKTLYRNNHDLPQNCETNTSLKVNFVNNSSFDIEIYKENQIIYSGAYISDISKYLSDNGRYYFHIYGKRKTGFWYKITKHISFNIIIGDDEYEK